MLPPCWMVPGRHGKEAVGNEDRVAGQGQKTHSQGCVFTGRRGSYCLVTGASRTFFVAFLVIWRPRLVSPTTEVSVHSELRLELREGLARIAVAGRDAQRLLELL